MRNAEVLKYLWEPKLSHKSNTNVYSVTLSTITTLYNLPFQMAHLLVSYGTHYLFTSEKLGLEKDFFGSFKYDAHGKVRWIKLLLRFLRPQSSARL